MDAASELALGDEGLGAFVGEGTMKPVTSGRIRLCLVPLTWLVSSDGATVPPNDLWVVGETGLQEISGWSGPLEEPRMERALYPRISLTLRLTRGVMDQWADSV